jgi:hypothetical protein
MTAKQLIKKLTVLVKEYGDKNILIIDSDTGWDDTIGDVRLVSKSEYNPNEGFRLVKADL